MKLPVKTCVVCSRSLALNAFEGLRATCRRCRNRARYPQVDYARKDRAKLRAETRLREGKARCSRCTKIKKLIDFPVRRNRKIPVHSWCSSCFNSKSRGYSARYYKRNRGRVMTVSQLWREKNRLRHKYITMRNQALHRGIHFDLSFEEYGALFRHANHCPVCGVAMTDFGGRAVPTRKSIDRADGNFGYVYENCACICHRCNQIKNCGTAAEHRRIAAWMDSWPFSLPVLAQLRGTVGGEDVEDFRPR